jgi:prepilin-type N-terminal cleavage/methylation domain-containing protein
VHYWEQGKLLDAIARGGRMNFLARMGRMRKGPQRGFSTTELVVVIAVILVVAAIAVPNTMQIWYNMELRATGDEVAGLMQQGRILAAKTNSYYALCYQTTSNGYTQVYLSKFVLTTTTPCVFTAGNTLTITLARLISAASAAPGGSPNPTNYSYALDTTSGTPCDNTCTLAYSPRGLPCKFVSSTSTCSTPAATYFVYYFQDSRPNGWTALLVTKAGRTKALTWNGTSWN